MRDLRVLRNDGLLILTAAIWGFAFVAQRAGMRHLEPFLFNGVRFGLGTISLLPIWILSRSRSTATPAPRHLFWGGFLAGSVLFAGASLQQIGMVYTTAGKGGFITGLYVVLVPLMGLFLGHRAGIGRWIGALFAGAGLYLLSIHGQFTIDRGDLLVFLGAFLWAAHVHVLAYLSPKCPTLALAALQYAVCSILSLIVAAFSEPIRIAAIWQAAIPILYGGVCSVGVAYTLQIIAQRRTHPTHAAIVLCLEGPFSVLGGRLILNETLSLRAIFGCVLMFTGMIAAQSSTRQRARDPRS